MYKNGSVGFGCDWSSANRPMIQAYFSSRRSCTKRSSSARTKKMSFGAKNLYQVHSSGARQMCSTTTTSRYRPERQGASLFACRQGSTQGRHPCSLQYPALQWCPPSRFLRRGNSRMTALHWSYHSKGNSLPLIPTMRTSIISSLTKKKHKTISPF